MVLRERIEFALRRSFINKISDLKCHLVPAVPRVCPTVYSVPPRRDWRLRTRSGIVKT